MDLKLHKNARTTPAVRKAIQESTEPVSILAKRYGVHETTIRTWKRRDTQHDRSHTRRHLPLKLTALEEELIVELRTRLRLSGLDIADVLRRSVNPEMHQDRVYRCLKRHGPLCGEKAGKTRRQAFWRTSL